MAQFRCNGTLVCILFMLQARTSERGKIAVAIAQGEFEKSNSAVSKLLGRSPTSVAEYLKTVYGKSAE